MPLIGDRPLPAAQAGPSVGRRRLILLVVAVAGVTVVLLTTRAHHRTASTTAGAGYCSLVTQYKTSLEQLSAAGQTEDLGARSAEVSSDIDRAAAAAPAEIKADMDSFARAYAQATLALSGAPGGSVDVGAFQALNAPELEAGLARVASYDKRVCGIG